MKIHCARCEINEELNLDEIKEVSDFILKNDLEAIDYLNYITLKRGKKCTDNKNHVFLFDVEWQEKIIELTIKIKSHQERQKTNEKEIEDMNVKMKELENKIKSKIGENESLQYNESTIIKTLIEDTGNDKLELWK